jgi:hypothetical protein
MDISRALTLILCIFPILFSLFFNRAKIFCQKVNFKIKKLSDIGGFQWPEVREKKEVKSTDFYILLSVCSQNI